MEAPAHEPASPIPSAPFDDLDLDRPQDEEEWELSAISESRARSVKAAAAGHQGVAGVEARSAK